MDLQVQFSGKSNFVPMLSTIPEGDHKVRVVSDDKLTTAPTLSVAMSGGGSTAALSNITLIQNTDAGATYEWDLNVPTGIGSETITFTGSVTNTGGNTTTSFTGGDTTVEVEYTTVTFGLPKRSFNGVTYTQTHVVSTSSQEDVFTQSSASSALGGFIKIVTDSNVDSA